MPDSLLPDGPEPRPGQAPLVRRAPDAVAAAVAPAAAMGPVAPPSAPPPPAAGGPPADDDELSLTELWRILRRRWMVALPVLVTAVAAAGFQYTQVTPIYEAATSIRLDKSKNQIAGLSPLATLQEQKGLGTEMQVLKSRQVAREVAKQTAYGVRVLSPRLFRSELFDSVALAPGHARGTFTVDAGAQGQLTLTGPGGQQAKAPVGAWLELDGVRLKPTAEVLAQGAVTLQVQSDGDAINRLQKVLKVTQPARDAEVLRMTVRDPDPRLAVRLSDGAAEVFTSSQIVRRQSGGRSTVEFIRTQLDSLDQQLLDAELKLRDWRAQQKVVVPTAEAGAAVERRADYEARLAEKRFELETVQGILRGEEGSTRPEGAQVTANFRRVLSAPLMRENQAAGTILSTLLQLESQRSELRVRRTEQDPDVQVLNRTLADYERQGQLFVASYLQALRGEIAGYESGLKRLGSTLQAFPGQELTLATLQRNTEVLAALQATLRTRLKEAEITNAAEDRTVELLDRAELPEKPVAPVLLVYAGVGVAAGILLALLSAVAVDRLDRTIHSREDIEQATGAALLGLIPSFTGHAQPKQLANLFQRQRKRADEALASARAATAAAAAQRTAVATGDGARQVVRIPDVNTVISVAAPRHVAAEAYRMLRTNLRFSPADRGRTVLSVSSPSPGDGKSTTSLNYSATLAVQGKRVLVIDADMRRGSIHQKLGLRRSTGLSAVLSGVMPVADAIRTVELAHGVTIDLLDCGDPPPNPTELLGGTAFSELLTWARGAYDQVVIDTPPVNMFADGLLVAAAADAMILIGRAGKSNKEELTVAAEQLRSLGVRLAGVVLNDFDPRRDGRFGSYYYGYYYYERYQYKYYAAYDTKDESAA